MSNILVRLGLDATAFDKGMAAANQKASRFATDFAKPFVALASAGVIAGLINDAVAYGSAVSDIALRTRLTTDEVQALGAAARDAGAGGIEAVDKAIVKMSGNITRAAAGNQEMARELKSLNLEAAALATLDPASQFEAIGRAVNQAENQAVAYNAVTRLFGEELGPKMLEVLQRVGKDGMGAVVKGAKEAGQVLDEELIPRLDAAADRLERVKNRAVIFAGAMAASVLKIADFAGALAALSREGTNLPASGIPLLDSIRAFASASGNFGEALDFLNRQEAAQRKVTAAQRESAAAQAEIVRAAQAVAEAQAQQAETAKELERRSEAERTLADIARQRVMLYADEGRQLEILSGQFADIYDQIRQLGNPSMLDADGLEHLAKLQRERLGIEKQIATIREKSIKQAEDAAKREMALVKEQSNLRVSVQQKLNEMQRQATFGLLSGITQSVEAIAARGTARQGGDLLLRVGGSTPNERRAQAALQTEQRAREALENGNFEAAKELALTAREQRAEVRGTQEQLDKLFGREDKQAELIAEARKTNEILNEKLTAVRDEIQKL